MIVCVNPDKLLNSKFELEIYSSTRLSNVVSNSIFRHKKNNFNIYSKWTKFDCGGGFEEITFYRNPIYILSVNKQTDTWIELISYDSYMISFLIIECETCEFNDYFSIFENYFNYNSFKNIRSSHEYFQEVYRKKILLIPNKKYLLIPFTKFPNLLGSFDITISSDEEVSIKEYSQFNKINSLISTFHIKCEDLQYNQIFKKYIEAKIIQASAVKFM
jgi:hypothetical protein